MDPTMMNAHVMGHQQYVFYQHADKRQPAQFQPHQMYPNVPVLPSTPVYSRPNSACSQPQAPTLYSNVPAAMTPMASPQPLALKPCIMLQTTEIRDPEACYPQTPPLSSSGSAVGSPGSVDHLQTPVNPMFSGLDGFKSEFDAFRNLEFDFSAASPPLTPMYSFQPVKASSTTNSSPESCPSLSPSPPPYARSVASSEHEVDFCDPRNLTNSASAPALATEDLKVEAPFNSEQTDFSFDHVPIVNDLFEDQSDLESLIHLDQFAAPSDARRPRAATGSSVLSLGHDSFISDDLSFCDEAFSFPCVATPTESESGSDCDSHRDKRARKSPKKEAIMPQMSAAASGTQSADAAQASRTETETSESKNNGSGSDGSHPPNPPPANRRGRKQSLTEDPSKTFVCDLCNRRFRRQEHLKRHYRSLHTQEKPFECNECGKKFSRSDNLAQHARTHGSGAIVMDLIEDHEAHMYAQPLMGNPEDYRHYGKVLFQVAAEMPGSGSESSEDDLHDNTKKRKRSE